MLGGEKGGEIIHLNLKICFYNAKNSKCGTKVEEGVQLLKIQTLLSLLLSKKQVLQDHIYNKLFTPFCLPPICWFPQFHRFSKVPIFYHYLLKLVNIFRFFSSVFSSAKDYLSEGYPNKGHLVIWKALKIFLFLFFVKFQVNPFFFSFFLVPELCRVLYLRD